jgi:hypothetical protein
MAAKAAATIAVAAAVPLSVSLAFAGKTRLPLLCHCIVLPGFLRHFSDLIGATKHAGIDFFMKFNFKTLALLLLLLLSLAPCRFSASLLRPG